MEATLNHNPIINIFFFNESDFKSNGTAVDVDWCCSLTLILFHTLEFMYCTDLLSPSTLGNWSEYEVKEKQSLCVQTFHCLCLQKMH